MTAYTRRVQTVLTDQQFEELFQLALETSKPVSVLVREAVETAYFVPKQRQQRLKALERLLALNAPVADWEQMEEEIIQGAIR
jgi:hypothetical protein